MSGYQQRQTGYDLVTKGISQVWNSFIPFFPALVPKDAAQTRFMAY